MDNAPGRQRAVSAKRRSTFCARRSRRSVLRSARSVVTAVALVAGACGSPRETESLTATAAPLETPDGRPLRSVVLPDLAKLAPSVQEQIRERHTSLMLKRGNRETPVPELSDAYGEMGKLLMAAEFADAAESCLLNAQSLNTSDFRWPYYLGHLYRTRGELAKSLDLFERANQLQPDDVATLVWLGDVALAQGRSEAAEPRFAKALSLQPGSLSARFGLGRTALAKQDYRRAVTYLEDVLARDPTAAGAHYPLAMAYSGLGEAKRADEHRRQRSEREILPADPLMVELEELLHSPQTYEKLGIRALDRKDWGAAAAEFRKGLDIDPTHPALRHRLGTALAMMGDDRGARAQFEEVVRVSPGYARAQYSLAVLAVEKGQHQEAIQRFSAALQSEPSYAEARIGLGASLRRTGRAAESLTQYERVLQEHPRLSEAAFGYAMALVQLRRYRAARDRLSEGSKQYADDSRFVQALARLLAAAPDDGVRDEIGRAHV